MFRYFWIILFFATAHALCASWDDYKGEHLVLFSLAPGTGEHYAENCQEQKLPQYFQKIAEQYPDIKAKIIAIDGDFSLDTISPEYAFLKSWENEGLAFRKGNIEIEFFKEWIPTISTQGSDRVNEYSQRVENYLTDVSKNGGVVFIGHHGQVYYAFEPFRIAYNKLRKDFNIEMYICGGDMAPFSPPKTYHGVDCSNEELDRFYDDIGLPYFMEFMQLDDSELEIKYDENGNGFLNVKKPTSQESKNAAYELLQNVIKDYPTSFRFYPDMADLPYQVERHEDGSLHILIFSEEVAAAAN